MSACAGANDGEDVGTLVHTLGPGTTRWPIPHGTHPLCVQELFWQILAANSDTKRGTLRHEGETEGNEQECHSVFTTQDANGEFTIPKEYIGVTSSPPLVKKARKEGKGNKENEEEEVDGFVSAVSTNYKINDHRNNIH